MALLFDRPLIVSRPWSLNRPRRRPRLDLLPSQAEAFRELRKFRSRVPASRIFPDRMEIEDEDEDENDCEKTIARNERCRLEGGFAFALLIVLGL